MDLNPITKLPEIHYLHFYDYTLLDLAFPIDVEIEIGNLLINNHINELNNLRVQLELILIKQ